MRTDWQVRFWLLVAVILYFGFIKLVGALGGFGGETWWGAP